MEVIPLSGAELKNNSYQLGIKMLELNALHDIKEEEDIELTQLNSNVSSICSRQMPLATSPPLTAHANTSTESIAYSTNGANDTVLIHNETFNNDNSVQLVTSNSKDELNLLPPLPDNSRNDDDISSNSNTNSNEMNMSNNIQNMKTILAENNENVNIHSNDIKNYENLQNDVAGLGLNIADLDQALHSPRNYSEQHFINSTSDSDSNDILDPESIAETSFDLSKALKIPQNFNIQQQGINSPLSGNNILNSTDILSDVNNSVNSNPYDMNTASNNLNINNNNGTLSPIITSPRLLLKKKFSNVMLNSNSGNIANSNIPDDGQSFQPIEFPITSSPADIEHSHSSSSSSHDTSTIASVIKQSRNPSRKISIGSSHSISTNNSMNIHYKNLNQDDLLYNLPIRTNGNPIENIYRTRSDSTSSSMKHMLESAPLESSSSEKRPPLLKRASSALLRKTSMIHISNSNSVQNNNNIKNDISASPSMSTASSFEPPTFEQLSDKLNYIAQTTSNTNNPNFDLQSITSSSYLSRKDDISRNPSIGSRVKRSFSRIISNGGDSVRRVVSNSNLRDESPSPIYMKNSNLSSLSTNHINSSERISSMPVRLSGSGRNASMPSNYRRIGSHGAGITRSFSATDAIKTSSTNISDSRSSSGRSKSSRTGSLKASSSNNGYESNRNNLNNNISQVPDLSKLNINALKVNVEKITKSVPVISVTDDFSSKHSNNYQIQSNIRFDEVYYGKANNEENVIERTSSPTDENGKLPEKLKELTIKEYINLLIKQQDVEDRRLQYLEESFSKSGWSSANDLELLRMKRVAINKKWADRISFYQNKLDA
ncbi:hypothetical protein TPHA_0H02450 [Tetrapisispora phaffii CBS 4417]|uniref:Uncharacterized protein n=1 Tax=Tetrapisispora phaffii (strain ATCC 24235 / CBS 4417 / NBRC 1672 / NRRL Y-8282 / UCD 70-5) TaxID=1071381 RepID=G8BWJ7_TETPH|nr:hypothetical protein TPHA_0H02450 [Tetrapisispora phaffii CBS 4417]CCE64448.1 hypothetical protein TPHA_0H02450 [Tetrapisispora phaffii CBS 4417]